MAASNLNLDQKVNLQVVRAPVRCSQCGEPRTQDTRCENCGSSVPYVKERDKNGIIGQ